MRPVPYLLRSQEKSDALWSFTDRRSTARQALDRSPDLFPPVLDRSAWRSRAFGVPVPPRQCSGRSTASVRHGQGCYAASPMEDGALGALASSVRCQSPKPGIKVFGAPVTSRSQAARVGPLADLSKGPAGRFRLRRSLLSRGGTPGASVAMPPPAPAGASGLAGPDLLAGADGRRSEPD